MFNFVKNYLTKKEGKKEYMLKLNDSLADGNLSLGERQDLSNLIQKYNLTKEDIIEANKSAFALQFKDVISDRKITEEEKKSLEELIKYFGLSLDEIKFDQKSFNKYYTLGLLDKGIVPTMSLDSLDIVYKKEEILHWVCIASINKFKNVTRRINYGGFTGSVKIMKGVRYRVGSVNVQRVTEEIIATEDTGTFWITNKRVGFKGFKKNFAFSYEKIQSFDVTKYGIIIAKEGRETPYIIVPDDIDIPCTLISLLLNEHEEM